LIKIQFHADSDKISEKTEKGCKETKMKEEEKLSSNDPRKFDLDNNSFYFKIWCKGDLEIQLLKARLEQTEASLERIVAAMGSLTSRLTMQDMQMGGQVWNAAVSF
jgi:hypothetical protein